MTDFRFESNEIEEPEIVSEFSMEGYEKFRLKTSKLTIDLAIVEMEGREREEYIQGRKEELNDSQTEVPHPYKPEKQQENKENNLVEFENNPLHGKGFADPEYNLISKDGTGIIRYSYLVLWNYFPSKNKLAEIEIYIPKNLDLSPESSIKFLETLKLDK